MNYTSFLLTAVSTGSSISTPELVKFMEEPNVRIKGMLFTNKDVFVNYPMDEISLSLESADIAIPSHLQTADELDEWIMNL